MTIYNANMSNIRRGVVDGVDPADSPPFADTDVQPIAWYEEWGGGAAGPYALRVHDTDQQAALYVPLAALASALTPIKTNILSTNDITLPAGGGVVALTVPALDVRPYRGIGYWVWNTGAVNPITLIGEYYAYDAAMTIYGGRSNVVAIGPVGGGYCQCEGLSTATFWQPANHAEAFFNYLHVQAASTLGTTCKLCVVGVK